MPAKGGGHGARDTSLGHRAGARAAARARPRRYDASLGKSRRQPARARRRNVPRPRALAPRRADRDRDRRRDRERDARPRRRDRRAGPRAGDGADARAARAPRLVPRDRPQRPPEPRLGGVRADRDRRRGRGALGQRLRVRGKMAVDDPLRRARRRARARRAGRVRPPLGAAVRVLGRARVARLSHLVDARPRRPRRVLGRAGAGRVALVRHRPDDRAARLVASARRRLHALHAGKSATRSRARRSAISSRTRGCTRSAHCSCSRTALTATRRRC